MPAAASPGDLAAYLKARVADADGASAQALANYRRALDADPANAAIALRLYREGIDAGDQSAIDRGLAVLDRAGVAPSDAALFQLAAAARARDAAATETALARLAKGSFGIIVPALRAWAAFEAGRDPLPLLASEPKDALARRFAAENRALLLIATGKTDLGIVSLQALAGAGPASADLRIAAAELLVAGGRRDRADAVLTGGNARLVAFRADPTPARASLSFALSRALGRIADDLGTADASPLTTALARAALIADPANDAVRLTLADQLARRRVTSAALAVLDAMPPRSPFADLARAERIQVLAAAGREADALSDARRLAVGRDASAADLQRFGELLAGDDRQSEAARVFARVIERTPQPGWIEWLQYGGALEQAGRWPEARRALERAVALGRDEPLALNYLGYAKAERGEDLAQAQAMLERAYKLRPDDPAIADSLGWTYFRRGDTTRALPLLERAAANAPDNPTINEHLGDAYWALGRRFEARYAWAAARIVADDAKEGERIAAKISDGLPRR